MNFSVRRDFLKRHLFFSVLFFFISSYLSIAEIYVSEIMFYDDIEWIEFYANGSYDISNLKLKDNYQSDEIVCCTENCDFFVNDEFFLIFAKNKLIDEIKNFENISIEDLESNNISNCNFITPKYFCVDDSMIGNGLGNQKDNITLFKINENKEQIFLTFYYDFDTNFYHLIPAKGKTLGLFNFSYYIMEKSPFFVNSYSNILFNFMKKNISNIIIDYNLTQKEDFSVNLSNVSISNTELSVNNSINQTDFFSDNSNFNTSLSNNSLILSNSTYNEAFQITKMQNSFFNLTAITFFNYTIELNITGYKGNTSKRAIYIYLENYKKNKTTFYVNSKFTFFNFSSRLNYNFCGNTNIILEGLDIRMKEEVNIPCYSNFFNETLSFNSSNFLNYSGNNNLIDDITFSNLTNNRDINNVVIKRTEIKNSLYGNQDTQKIFDKSKKQYNLINFSFSSNFVSNNYFSALLEINNLDNISHFYKIHFYAYNGTKRFSDENIFEISIKPKNKEIILLENKLNKNVNGLIKVKIKIFREDRKTAYEITNSMNVYYVDDINLNIDNNNQDYDILSFEEQSNNIEDFAFENNSSKNFSIENYIYDNMNNSFLINENKDINFDMNFDTFYAEEKLQNFNKSNMITGNLMNLKDSFKINFKDKLFIKSFIFVICFFVGLYFLFKKH